MKIELTNNYHDTETVITIAGDGTVGAGQLRRAHNTLCGSDSCTCGNEAGESPARHAYERIDNTRYRVIVL